MDKICAREGCGCVIQGSPSYVKKRKYCSQACNAMVNFGIKNVEVTKSVTVEVPAWLVAVRKSLKATGKAYKYNNVGEAIGEYDWDGNLVEY